MSFKDFNLSDPIQQAISDIGFETPSEIQAQAIPYLIDSDDDFVAQAQTGTGKTAAFLLPLLERINLKSKNVEAIIMTPTRELAHQVYCELEKFSKHLPLRATTVYGGASYRNQIDAIKKDRAQVIVGTPGRVIDLINKGILALDRCTQLIIDEADEMLNMGFLEDVETIISELPSERRLWMFSATMPKPIMSLISDKFEDPKIIRVKKKTLSNENITQSYCLVQRKDFSKALKRILHSKEDYYAIAFCETREETKRLAEGLVDAGLPAMALHGELSQNLRDQAMRRFKEQKIKLLVCTDVASRGIDVSNLTHVFNMGLPRQSESYVHRIGRTGRAGEKGEAISFITPNDAGQLRRVERLTGKKMEVYNLPDSTEIKKVKVLGEIGKMQGLKTAILERGEEFKLDECFQYFQNDLKDLSKDQLLKLIFSYHFNKEIRLIEEGLAVTPITLQAASGRGDRSRDRGRSRNRNGGGRRDRGGQRSRSRNGEGGASFGGRRRSNDRKRTSSDSRKRRSFR